MKKIAFCTLLLLVACQKPISEKTVVGILSYKGFPKEKAILVSEAIDSFYHIETLLLTEKELPKQAFINVKSPRYRADSIIRIQKRNFSEGYDFILGLTEKDISTTKTNSLGKVKTPESKYKDWGIMGLAYCPGNSAIVSTFRLKNKNTKIQTERLIKVAVHEFGHNLGLPHCINKLCVMTDAVESIATIDNAKRALCKKCSDKLQ